MSLQKLPREMVIMVTRDLDIQDIFHLALSCRQFQGLLYVNSIAKHALETNAPATFEAIEAQSSKDYARSLRRLFKRRAAVSTASPFQAAIIAVAETYMYRNGVLFYILDRKLRILDLHHSSSKEIRVDIRVLLDQCIEESLGTKKYKFHLVHFSDGIVTCRYTHAKPDVEHWLVMFHVRDRWAVSGRLDSTYKLFVRNNREYLYYGTHSEFGGDGFRRWVLRGYSFASGHWLPQKVYLDDLVGSDIGSQVVFEIFDGFLYGVANMTEFEATETESPSYYYCFRFPLRDPRPEKLELPDRDSLWRRPYAEGPVDDRWTWLSLQRDDLGNLQILESRKEWLAGSRKWPRTLYRKAVVFSSSPRSSPTSPQLTTGSASNLANNNTEETVQHTPSVIYAETANQTTNCTTACHQLPQDVHPDDEPAATQRISLRQSFIRLYHDSSSSFVDMVDVSDTRNPKTQQVQLRVVTRTPNPLETMTTVSLNHDSNQDMDRIHRPSRLRCWPDQAHLGQEICYEIDKVLNPPAHTGNLRGTWDDRSLLYATGDGRGELRAIVFIGFDPGTRLRGMKTQVKKESGEVVWTADPYEPKAPPPKPVAGSATERLPNSDGVTWDCPVRVAGPSTKPPKAVFDNSCARIEDAMFLNIERGFNFSSTRLSTVDIQAPGS